MAQSASPQVDHRKAGAGDIIILQAWPEKTAEALPELIRIYRAKGLRFVTVSELLALSNGN